MNKAIIISPDKISPLFEMHMHSLMNLFLDDSVGNKLRNMGIGWTVCKETYHLRNVLPSSPSIAFVLSGEKQLHHEGCVEYCPRGGLTLFPAGVPVCMSNISFAKNEKKKISTDSSNNEKNDSEDLGYVALCVSFTQETMNTVSHLLASNAQVMEKECVNALSDNMDSSHLLFPISNTSSVTEKLEKKSIKSEETAGFDVYNSDDFLLTILGCLDLMCNHLSSNANRLTSNLFASKILENVLFLIASHQSGLVMLDGAAGIDILPLRLRELFRKQLSYHWKLADVALNMHMTERTVRRHLEKSGYGIRELLRSERLHAGLLMLQQTNNSVESIAWECGYSSASRFSRRFSELFGVLPHQMRKARGNWGDNLSV